MKYIKFLIIAVFGFCFGLDLEGNQFRKSKPKKDFFSTLKESERSAKEVEAKKIAQSKENSKQQVVVGPLAPPKKEFFHALELQEQESRSFLPVFEVAEEEYFDAVSTFSEEKEEFVNNGQIVLYVERDKSLTIKINDETLRKEIQVLSSSKSLNSFPQLVSSKKLLYQNKLLAITYPQDSQAKTVSEAKTDKEQEGVDSPAGPEVSSVYVQCSNSKGSLSSSGRISLSLFALPQSASGSLTLPSHFNDSKIASSSFLSRNKVAIVAASALVGGVAYYAATRGLRPETIVKDLKAAKNFCVDNAGKAKEKTIELVGSVKEKAPELKSKFNFGLAAIGSYAISGFNNLKWILEDSELE